MKNLRMIGSALALAALVFSSAAVAQTALNPIPREPVLLYDVTGGTIAGPTHTTLAVFSDGSVSLAVKDGANPLGTVETKTVPVARVNKLARDLQRAGAANLRDGSARPVPDVPLTTVTVFLTSARTPQTTINTFSYYVADRPRVGVGEVIQSFLDEVF